MSRTYSLIKLPRSLRSLAPPTVEVAHEIRLLEINGKCPVFKELTNLWKKDKTSFERLANVVQTQLMQVEVLRDPKKVRRGRGTGKGMFEFKGGNSRLFWFLSRCGKLIICTNTYWKTGDQEKEQAEAFGRGNRMRLEYGDGLQHPK